MATRRLNQLKSKENSLKEESSICKQLIDTILMKIHNSIEDIKELEHEEPKLTFNKKVMNNILAADKFNQILLQFNLMLEEFSEENKIDLDYNSILSTVSSNVQEQETYDNVEKKNEESINEQTTNLVVVSSSNNTEISYVRKNKRNDENKNVRKSIPKYERRLSDNDEFKICRNPATFAPEDCGEPSKEMPENTIERNSDQNLKKINRITNNELKTCHNTVTVVPGTVSKTNDRIIGNVPETKKIRGSNCNETVKEKRKIDYRPTINSIRKHEIESKDSNDQEISHRKVLEYLQKQPERPFSSHSNQKTAIKLGAPELTESKFHISKKLKQLKKSNSYTNLNSFNELEEIVTNNEHLQILSYQSAPEENVRVDVHNVKTIEENINENAKMSCSNVNDLENEVKKSSSETHETERLTTPQEILPETDQLDEVIEKLSDGDKVTVQDNDKCIVTHINSPGCFYIITASEIIVDYDRFHELLQRYCESDKSKSFSNKQEMMTVGSNYFCCYNDVEDYDYTWFRCIITDWLLNNSEKENVVKVLAVDDGFEKEISLDQFRDYPDIKFKMPRMAIKCRLRDVYPPGSSEDNILTDWPEDIIQFFHDLVRDSRSVAFTVADVRKNNDFYEINLRNTGGVSVSKVMIHMNFGVLIKKNEQLEKDKSIDAIQQQTLQAQDQLLDDEYDWENMDDIEENLNQAVANAIEGGYTPKDAQRLCRFTKVDGQPCFKGERCRYEHKLPDSDGWTMDKTYSYSEIINKLEMPEKGAKIKLLVTCIISVCRFYAHLKLTTEQKKRLLSLNIAATATQFSKFVNKPEHVKTLTKFRILPAVGQLVLAKSPVDDRWYRAKVISGVDSKDEFEVLFIDYGDRSVIPFNNLRQIRKEHLGMPEQAIDCRIANIDPLDLTDTKMATKAAQELSNLIIDKTCTAVVIDNGYPLEILLYTENGIDVGEHLKALNFATERSSQFKMKSKERLLDI